MDTLLPKLGKKIKGVITGFDRIVFKGHLRPLCHVTGMTTFLHVSKVLYKDYNDWISGKSAIICQDAYAYTKNQCGLPVQYLPTHNIRKDALVQEHQKKTGITEGLIGTWSCVESCNTYKAAFNNNNGQLYIKREPSKCKHLYFYYDHSDYGLMSIRLQTWAPYEIQIALNGRHWLKRSWIKPIAVI